MRTIRGQARAPRPRGSAALVFITPVLRARGQPFAITTPGDTPDPATHKGHTPTAHPRPSGSPARAGTMRGKQTAATAAGLAGCRPNRSAKHFLTSHTLRAREVRKLRLHRTAPTQAKNKDQGQDRGGTLNPAPERPKRPRGAASGTGGPAVSHSAPWSRLCCHWPW
jgi:hypothetical protein